MLFDTSAWIEFFQGTEKGKKVREILDLEENFTSIVTFAEITFWCLKNNQENKIMPYLEGIKKGSKVIDLEEIIVINAGKLNYERKKVVKNWGLMDSFLLSTALLFGLKILTKDSHFRNLPNTEML